MLSEPTSPDPGKPKVAKCTNIKGIDRSLFRADVSQSPLVTGSPDDVDDLLDLYNATLLGLLNKSAAEKEKVVPDAPSSPCTRRLSLGQAGQAARATKETEKKPL